MLLFSVFLLPIVGAVLLSLVQDNCKFICIKFLALLFAISTFFLSIVTLILFDSTNPSFQFVSYPIKDIGIGIDGISLPFLLLTTFLFVICIIYNCQVSYKNLRMYVAISLLLESFIIGFFISLNAISFYIFFEAVLIPMFFIIGIWGDTERVYATFKLFIYTLAGSLLFLLGLIYIYSIFNTLDIQALTVLVPGLDFKAQVLLWLAFFIAFAVKIPMFPFHTWLPDAHVQSPTSGSVILAGILIKMGGYGLLRFSIPMLPEASLYFSNFIILLSIIAVIYTSLIAFSQDNIKKLIAYSSIAHMGIVTAGLFSFYEEGTLGALFHMISHGLISAVLFLCVGMLYTRTKSLKIEKYGGIAHTMPRFSMIFIFVTMASIGLPGTSGFVGEFLAMIGIFAKTRFTTGFIALGTILSAVYMLNLCRKIIWGVGRSNMLNDDLNKIELSVLILLTAYIIILGFYPTCLLNYFEPCIRTLFTDL